MHRPKIRYFVDSRNRLNAWRVDSRGRMVGPKRVYEGGWGITGDQHLTYRLKEKGIPVQEQEVNFSGRWSLTPDHQLRLTLDRKETGRVGDELSLAGAIVIAEKDEIGFAVTTKNEDGISKTRVLRLSGKWRADEKNRLLFGVERANGKHDPLVFQGAWEIGKYHEIIYRYETREGVKGKRVQQSFALLGRWEITDRRHLVYRLDKRGKSILQFRVSIETPTLRAKKGEIRFQLGAGRTFSRKTDRDPIVLFGKWKLSRNLSVGFEIEYENGRRQTIQFDTDYHLNSDKSVSFSLKDTEGEKLGLAVTFTKDLLAKSGQAFLRLRRHGKEAAVEGGISIPF